MSDLKVVDSHFHVWNLDTQSLPWLDGTDGTITHTYKVEDLEAEYARQAGVEFVGGVYVEVDCADHEAEDKIAFDLKAAHPKMLACMLRSDVSPWMRVPAFAAGRSTSTPSPRVVASSPASSRAFTRWPPRACRLSPATA